MAKAKMKEHVIPRFSSESQEAEWWDSHRSEIEAEIRQRMKHRRPLTLGNLIGEARPSQPITLRIPTADLETARRLAAQQGLGYQTYIKMLLRGALAKNAADGFSGEFRRIPVSSKIASYELKTIGESSREIRFRSYNPYESVYPGLRVVSRETLHLIKTLRAQGYFIVVEPDDGTKLNYLAEKGFRELLSDPVYAFVVGIPTGLILNLIANWISQLKRRPKPDEVNLVLEFEENGNKVRYSESGQLVSQEKFQSILTALEARKHRFEESRKVTTPYPGYVIPVHLEHTGKVVGWSKGFIFDDQKKTIAVDETRICDDQTRERIQRGELRGFSVAGIVSRATCLICGRDYVDCDHIAGINYGGRKCTVRTTTRPAEISIVKDPVQPLARIRIT